MFRSHRTAKTRKFLPAAVLAAVFAGCASEPPATSPENTKASPSTSAGSNELFVQKIADNTYVTYGYGVSEADARLSAIRNGLQYATQQLVISEIKIESDELVTDLLYSTMNGYIEKFDVFESVQKGDEYFVRATLNISDSEIKATVDRFTGIGVGIENTSYVDSGELQSSIESIYAERARRRNQIFVARKLYKEMARGWPEQAYNITLKELTVDKSNPTVVTLVANVAYDNDWLDSFKAHQKLIGDLTGRAPSFMTGGSVRRDMNRICWRQFPNVLMGKLGWEECVYSPGYGSSDPFSGKNRPISICAFDSKRQFINRLEASSTHLVFNPKKDPRKLEVFLRTPQLLTRKFPVSDLVKDGRYPEYFRFSVGSPCDDVY